MSSGLKKTLFFAVDNQLEISKNLAKSVVLENISLEPIKIKSDKAYNVVNVKLLPDEEGVLELEFDQLEEMLSAQAKEYQKMFLKKYPNTIVLQEKDYNILNDKQENDREEKLTSHLNPEQKLVRGALVKFKKEFHLTGTEASFVSNIFDDIVSLKPIDETTVLGTQKKTIASVFPDKNYMVELVIDAIERLQIQVAAHRMGDKFDQVDTQGLETVKGVWPNVKKIMKDKKVEEAAAAAREAAARRSRGRPRKNVF